MDGSLYTIRNKTVTIPVLYLKDILRNNKYDVYDHKRGGEIIIVDMKYSYDSGVELATVNSAYIL